jgi:tRNA dimethylallyltransferase
MEKIEVSVIYGPTASGKSDLAMEWAKKNNGEIISIDSIQIYKGMDIGSAKPDKSMLKEIKHHMIDIISPDQKIDARTFALQVRDAIVDINRRGRHPVLVGGSGLYFDAVFHDFFECPPSNPAYRDIMRNEWEKDQGESLHKKLSAIDPTSASKINKHNMPRLVRAIEVFELTGRPFSSAENARRKINWLSVGYCHYLNPDRELLYNRINQRTIIMFAEGWLSEVESLIEKYGFGAKGLEAIGYREIAQYLLANGSGQNSQEKLIELIQQNTRRFAKRQITWFSKYGIISEKK